MDIVTAPTESQITYAKLRGELVAALMPTPGAFLAAEVADTALRTFRRALEVEALRLVRMPDSLQLARRVLSIADALAPVDLPEPVEEGQAR